MPDVRLITPITKQNAQKTQVAAYCRVSSNSADQLNSYAAQIRTYKKVIGARRIGNRAISLPMRVLPE